MAARLTPGPAAGRDNVFSERVLAWFDRHGRKDLPWQRDITPYRVWVSEIMLQQTQVRTVIPYFERFMDAFPDVQALAAASEDAVLHLWTGLGYYSRARNLLKTARIIANQYDGAFPDDVDALSNLPGIGRSTAGAIIAIAYRKPATILDGNVKRVLARFHAVEGFPGESAVLKTLWTHADAHTPASRVADYTQAMMDLGATLCTRTKPACGICPLTDDCAARQTGTPQLYPGRKPKKTLPVQATRMLLIRNARDEILLEKRPPSGIWASLWIFPQAGMDADPVDFCRDTLQLRDARVIEHWQPWRHTFSHYHLDIAPCVLQIRKTPAALAEAGRFLWYDPASPASVGLAAPVRRLLDQLHPSNPNTQTKV
jgi:A/G-specific adenine glycosylase